MREPRVTVNPSFRRRPESSQISARGARNPVSTRRLRFDATLNPKKSAITLEAGDEVTFVPMDAIGEMGKLDTSHTKEVAEVYDGYTYFENNDVCVAKITPCFENGKGFLAEGLTNGVGFGTTELHVIRPHATLDARYLFYLTMAHDFRKIGASEMLGAGGQKRVPEDFIKNWMPTLPPVEDQRRIARFLDKKMARIDALIEKKRALLERLAEKRQALITQAVTKGLDPDAPMKDSGIDWLGRIPAHWGLAPFKWRCQIQSGQVDPTDPMYSEMPLVAPDHIESASGRVSGVTSAEEQGAISGKYLCPEGSVLYSKIRPALRKVALFDGECLCSADMYAINPGLAFDRRFLFYFLLTDAFTSYAELESMRVAMPKVNRDALGSFMLPLPKLIEQQQIGSYCHDVHSEIHHSIDVIQNSLDRLIEYRTALVTAAVTGQLKLKQVERDKEAVYA